METTGDIYPKEFTLKEILSIAWEMCKRYYKEILPLAFIVYLPLNIFITLFPIGNINGFKSDSYISWFEIFGTMNVAVYLSFFGNIAISMLIKDRLEKNNSGIFDILSRLYPKSIKNLRINIFMIFIVFACFNFWMYSSIIYPVIFLLLLIPIVVYLVNWSFSIYVFSFKDMNLYESMKYSYSLVNYRWARVCSKVIILILLSLGMTLIAGLPYSYLHDTFFMRIIYTNLISVVTSYFVVAFIVFYINFDDTRI